MGFQSGIVLGRNGQYPALIQDVLDALKQPVHFIRLHDAVIRAKVT